MFFINGITDIFLLQGSAEITTKSLLEENVNLTKFNEILNYGLSLMSSNNKIHISLPIAKKDSIKELREKLKQEGFDAFFYPKGIGTAIKFMDVEKIFILETTHLTEIQVNEGSIDKVRFHKDLGVKEIIDIFKQIDDDFYIQGLSLKKSIKAIKNQKIMKMGKEIQIRERVDKTKSIYTDKLLKLIKSSEKSIFITDFPVLRDEISFKVLSPKEELINLMEVRERI